MNSRLKKYIVKGRLFKMSGFLHGRKFIWKRRSI